MKPRLLDLFCGAGGASMGYHEAGFEVVGVDINPQKRYPFEFHQADALTYPLEGFDVIHASPPCQKFTSMRHMPTAKEHADLLTPTRERLVCSGLPYVIENVVGAPMRNAITLCGTMFGLGTGDAELRRHRLFETAPIGIAPPPCDHGGRVIGIYGGHGRDRRRSIKPNTVGVWGHSGGSSKRQGVQQFTGPERCEAMGISWMTVAELSQAIPPAYTRLIGASMFQYLDNATLAA